MLVGTCDKVRSCNMSQVKSGYTTTIQKLLKLAEPKGYRKSPHLKSLPFTQKQEYSAQQMADDLTRRSLNKTHGNVSE